MSGIYCITNKVNNRKYIGYTERNFTSRVYQHLFDLRHGKHHNRKLQNDFDTYGINGFTFELVEEVKGKDELVKVEQKYIDQIDLDNDYNLVNGSLADMERNVDSFIGFMNDRWLLPKGLDIDEMKEYRIYRTEDKDKIVENAICYQIMALLNSYITFNRIIRYMQDSLGYAVETGRFQENNKRYTYKLIIDFNEEKVTIGKDENLKDGE